MSATMKNWDHVVCSRSTLERFALKYGLLWVERQDYEGDEAMLLSGPEHEVSAHPRDGGKTFQINWPISYRSRERGYRPRFSNGLKGVYEILHHQDGFRLVYLDESNRGKGWLQPFRTMDEKGRPTVRFAGDADLPDKGFIIPADQAHFARLYLEDEMSYGVFRDWLVDNSYLKE